jgi:two-component system response regulator MprA
MPASASPNRSSQLRKVLFVEDEQALQTSYERFFDTRYEMAFASTGAEAMTRLGAFHPDILVLDLRLPDTDGIALLQKIRQANPELPVVVTTAYVSMEPLMSVLDLGHSGYLVKPFDLNELAARIDAVG